MKPPVDWLFAHFHAGILRSASLVVPAKQRAEWMQEWHAELWHVRQACASTGALSGASGRAVTAFCLGAFKDAFWMMRHAWRRDFFAPMQGSAAQCILSLVFVFAISYAMSLLLPGVRAENHPSRYHVNPDLILIQDARYSNDSVAAIPLEQFLVWKRHARRYFDDMAFYRIRGESVSSGQHGADRWEVAQASSNLFSLLGLKIGLAETTAGVNEPLPRLILSEDIWQRQFHGDLRVVGTAISIGERQAVIAGVVVEGAWRLPGKADAWLLERDSDIGSYGMGHVVAHLTPLGRSEVWIPQVQLFTHIADEPEDDLWGASLDERTQGPLRVYLFSALLALLALPAITSVSLGESDFTVRTPSWSTRLLRCGFLGAKVALLLAIAYFSSLDLAYWHTTRYSIAAQYVQLLASFSICLFGMRWVLLDQRQRCPVCLKRVTNPARVGMASRTFLAWSGTELICTGGHALLHVPGAPTSWFGTQRWLYLDASWECLFAASRAG